MRLRSSVLLLVVLAGCAQPWKQDPNVSVPGRPVSGDVLARNIAGLMADLDEREAKGAISAADREAVLQGFLERTLEPVVPEQVPDGECWQFGDAYRLRGDWEQATKLYERAVKAAHTEDRKVNDSLRLARALAHAGRHEEAIAMARSTFDASETNKAPILMAVLYEIVPEAGSNAPKKDYAVLLLDAIAQHRQTVVDAGSPEGAAFLETRSVHIRKAYVAAANLLMESGDRQAAREALLKAEQTSTEVARI